MSCGMCGGSGRPAPKWEVAFPDGATRVYLTEVEARVAATSAGGGTIRRID